MWLGEEASHVCLCHHLDQMSVSLFFFKWKWCSTKRVANPISNTSGFPQDNHCHALVCNRVLYEYFLFHHHRILKRCVLKGRNNKINNFHSSINHILKWNCFFFFLNSETWQWRLQWLDWFGAIALGYAQPPSTNNTAVFTPSTCQQTWGSLDIWRTLIEAKAKCH